MLVWRDKIACHGPRLPAISLLPLPPPPPSPSLCRLILSIRCASGCRHDTRLCTRFPRYDKQRDAVAGLVDTRDVISAFRATTSCEMNERFGVERPRNRRTNHQLNYVRGSVRVPEGKKFVEKAWKRDFILCICGEI